MSQYPGRVISATPPAVSPNGASGVWTTKEVLQYKKAQQWPVQPTGWDIDGSYFQGIARSATLSEVNDIKFSSDGTKMYNIGATRDAVLQYDLAYPFQPRPTTLSGANTVMSGKNLSSEETAPRGVEFKSDGSKMYIVGETGDDVNEYSLSTPWDVNTASYVQNFSVASETTAPRKVRFKSDGTKMYILGGDANTIYQYSLSTAWDISTATYDTVNLNVGDVQSQLYGMTFSSSGTELFIIGLTYNIVFKYILSSAWDLSTATAPGFITPFGMFGNPFDIKFSSDGTKMYSIATTTYRTLVQFELSTPYQVSTAKPFGKNVSAEETTPRGVEFKPDGTKMYVVGTDSDSVNQYDLSVAWDVTSASYVQNFSVATETGAAPVKVRFKPDGTKMYVLSNTNDTVFQYSLSTAWDISTASYDSVSLNAGAQESVSWGLFFGDSGTKMYVVGTNLDRVFQYDLSTAWDLSTASYSGKWGGVNARDGSPVDVFFKDDGTIMYMIGTTSDNIHQFSLSTAWDVSTIAFTKASGLGFPAWVGEDGPSGFYIKPDGSQLYVTGPTTDRVWQLSMRTVWDIGIIVPGFYVNTEESTPTGIAFKSDGTKVYVIGSTNDTVYQYSLTTAWNVLTASYDSVSFSVAAEELTPQGLTFKPDGTKMYIVGTSGGDVNEYNLSTAWNVSTASFVQAFSVSAETGALPQKVEFSSDGTKMLVLSQTNNALYQYNLSSAWNISTATYSSTSFLVGSVTSEPVCTGFTFADSGTKLYTCGTGIDTVYGFLLNTGWSLSSILGNFKSVTTQEGSARDVLFKPDGTRMYVIGDGTDQVIEYELSTAWDLYTASYVKASFGDLATIFGLNPLGMYISPDGSQAYAVGTAVVYRLSMSTPWDVGTLTSSYYLGSQDSGPIAMYFKPDGTKMYILGSATDSVYQYSLTNAWDVFTATYDSKSFSVGTEEIDPRGLTFKPDGTKMYVVGATGDDVNEYDLSTAWDVSTATYAQNFSVATETGTSPQKVEFSSDGTKMFVASNTTDTIYQYSLSVPWDISTATYSTVSYDIETDTPGIGLLGLAFADSGKKMYITQNRSTFVSSFGFVLDTPWDLTTLKTYYKSMWGIQNDVTGITFKPGGTEMYITGIEQDTVSHFTLSSPWQVQTASYVTAYNFGAQTTVGSKTSFKDDGTKMYVLGNNNDTVFQYSLSTAWDISTATYDSVSFVTSGESSPHGMFFGDSGTKLYISGTGADAVRQYTLATPWDISTASYSGLSKSIAPQDPQPLGVFFDQSGTRMYVVGLTTRSLYQYSLSTAWDVSTATYLDKGFDLSNYMIDPRAIWFKEDGTYFYAAGPTPTSNSDGSIVYQFAVA